MNAIAINPVEDRVLPHDLRIEQAVIGSALLGNPDTLDKLALMLKSEYFYHTPHRKIFSAICRIHQKGNPVDQVSVYENLAVGDEDKDRNTSLTLVEAIADVATDSNAEYHAIFIQKFYQRRKLINDAQSIIQQSYDSTREVDDLLADAARISESASIANGSRGHTAGDAVSLAVDRYEWAVQNDGALTGLPTGIGALDVITDGFQDTDFIILAARPGEGKTSLAIWSALAMSKIKRGVFFTLEMPASAIGKRLITANTLLDGFRFRTGNLDASEQKRLIDAENELQNLLITIYDDVYSLSEVLALTRMHKRNEDIGWVVIDYLQLMHGERKSGDNREQEVAKISFSLRQLAKALSIPVIALCQLSRAGAARPDRRPQLSDLRESGSLEQDASMVIFPHRPIVHGKRTKELKDGTKLDLRYYGELIVAKQREGEVGFVEVETRMSSGYWGQWRMDEHILGGMG
jgi:replicative DNA helicase